jgi:adenosylcobinamide kinase/adenosylcobinamide-phosphate guanylyltransferase
MGTLTLITGGARSGKSALAEQAALASPPPVVYVATAEALDDEMRQRIAEHRSRRPSDWTTIEAQRSIGVALAWAPGPIGTVLLEDLGLLVSNLLLGLVGDAEPDREVGTRLSAIVADELTELLDAWEAGGWDLIVVTHEVGMGVVPPSALGRLFRDALGTANQRIAARADFVYLVVAGQPLRIKPRDGG